MEQHKQMHVELSEEELQKATGGDNKTFIAAIGSGVATVASIGAGAYYIGQQVKKVGNQVHQVGDQVHQVGNNVAVTRATAETGLEYSRNLPDIAKTILHH